MASTGCGGSQASRGPSLQRPRPQHTWLFPRSTQNQSITHKPAADLRSQDFSFENTTFKVKNWPLSVFSASRCCYLVYSSTFLCTSIIILFPLFYKSMLSIYILYTVISPIRFQLCLNRTAQLHSSSCRGRGLGTLETAAVSHIPGTAPR